jgi:hypothetical protein
VLQFLATPKTQKGEPMAPLFVLLCRLKSSLLSVAVLATRTAKAV